MSPQPPTGTVTFLFTDIEGSTKLAREHPEQWEIFRARHHAILQSAIDAHNGYVFQIIGDAFCVAFHNAGDALSAALKAQNDLHTEKWGEAVIKVRMGIHTGKAEIQESGQYIGYLSMSRVQRVMSVAYGGQVLISSTSGELIRNELPEGVSLLDMKEHRLKGLLNPEHLWQAVSPNLPRDFPPLQSLNEIPNNLPIQLTSFIGREKEIAELIKELDDHRMVTLTGSGGTGKSRLSLEVAAEVIDSFPDGVWFVELAPVTDPALVPNTLANLLGLRESGESRQSISELICNYFHSRKALLVFDNCEHLIDSCARFADLLLRSCKDVKILASSREALGVAGEMAWHVPSLSLPDINNLPAFEQLSQFEAVRLFIERVILVQPHFLVTKENAPAIAQICFRLDGIPLALELAAARANVLAVEQIAKRLDDRFRLLTGGSRTALPRQQTLRAMIDWSYNLLPEEERLLFRRLAVFVGGWTLETAEAVCSGGGIEPDLILDLLSQLVKKSLVVMKEENGESRYHFLETIRQYAREILFESGEGQKARNRHLQAFDEMTEKAELKLTGSEQIVWLDRLEVEHGNLRGALEWSIESNVETGLRLGSALWRFWLVRGYLTEGREWLEQLLSAPKNAQSDYVISRAKALYVASHLSLTQGDNARGSALAEESLTLCRKTDDDQQLAFSLAIAGRAANLMDDLPRAETLYGESLELFRVAGDERGTRLVLSLLGTLAYSQDDMQRAKELQEQCLLLQKKMGDIWEITETLNVLGQIARIQGDFERSIEIHEEGLGLARELGSKPGIAHGLNLLAWVVREQGDFERAALLYEECLVMSRELGNKWRIAGVLNGLGVIAWRQGYFERARALLDESLDLRKEIGNKVWIVYGQINLGDVLRSQGNLAQAEVLYKDALTALINMHSPNWDLLECLRRIAAVTGAQKGVKKAATLFGAVATLREVVNIPLPPLDQSDYDRDVAFVREQLGEESFHQAWSIGKSMSMEDMAKFALEETDE